MGINPSQMAIIEDYLSPEATVLTVGRQTLNTEYRAHPRDIRNSCYFDDYYSKKYPSIKIDSMDSSEYQGAKIIQDLNLPLTQENLVFEGQYDLIIDGGSLEHFFNIPQALENYNALLKVGGVIYITTNANNHFGHGFYQFSSDLFYQVFSSDNNYEVIDCFLEEHPLTRSEVSSRRKFYDAPNPESLRRRTQFTSCRPVLIHVIARKLRQGRIKPSVIQSDYQQIWKTEENEKPPSQPAKELAIKLLNALPALGVLYAVVEPISARLSWSKIFRRRRALRVRPKSS